MSEELINRTKKFCLEVIKLAKLLPNNYLSNHFRGQIIRAGTSVAANTSAARLAQSRAAFIAKISIVIEEADESSFWAELILEEELLTDPLVSWVKKEANEIASIFISTRKTMAGKK